MGHSAFDPKPFIRTFEAAVDKLIAVRKDVQAKTEQMEKSVRVAERDYSKKMTDLNQGFEVRGTLCFHSSPVAVGLIRSDKAVGQSFSGMETKMNDVGRTAIRIGEQMESVHQQRQRAQAAYDLIDYYNQFAKDDTARLDALKKEGKDGRRKVAVLLRRLATVAKEVDLPHADKVRYILICCSGTCSRGVSRHEKTSIGIAKSLRRTCYTCSIERIGEVTRR